MKAKLPITILTGFLGAGKTSLLNQLLLAPGMANSAVIVNEFGAISLDHDLVTHVSDGVIQLANGCLCCTIRGDLIDRLLELYSQRASRGFERVLIEMSGVADPGPILQALFSHPRLSQFYRLNALLCLVDGVVGRQTLSQFVEAQNQVRLADAIIITKLAAPKPGDDSHLLRQDIRRFNQNSPIMLSQDMAPQDIMAFDGALVEKREGLKNSDHHAHSHSAIKSFTLSHDGGLNRHDMEQFFGLCHANWGANILRMKAIIWLKESAEQPYIFHGVQGIYSQAEPLAHYEGEEKGRSHIVFITQNVGAAEVERLFYALTNRPDIDSPDRGAILDNPLAIPGLKF